MANFDNSAGRRSLGVGVPLGQLSPGTGVARTVTGFMEMKNVAIEYVDDNGNKHHTIALLDAHGTWYLPPNGENFAASLKPLAKHTWLAQELDKIVARRKAAETPTDPTDVPAQDTVEVG